MRVWAECVCVFFKLEGEDNIKMDLQEVGWGSKDCIDLTMDRYR